MIIDKPEPLGSLLIKKQKITDRDLEKSLSTQEQLGQKLGRILVQQGLIKEEDLARVLSEQLGVPYLSLGSSNLAPPRKLGLTLKYMQEYKFFPVRLENNVLHVAMSNPMDTMTIDSIRLSCGYELAVYISNESEIVTAIDRYYGEGMDGILEDLPEEDIGIISDDTDENIDQLRDMALEAPVIKLVNMIITRAIEAGASDVHIESFERELLVRYRIDGILHRTESPPKRLQSAIVSRIKIMADMNIAERRLPQDGRIKVNVMGRKVDLRVSCLPTMHGESVVMRILDQDSILLTLDDLGFTQSCRNYFEQLIDKPHGILLITGPTGSGKTTTLYAALNKINSPDKKIITVEDPIEYQLLGINQTQVKSKIGYTFANGLRSIMRQDPDIIMIGEIRDLETAEIAVQSSLTGHLVFSTLHTNDAPSAITRLIDMGVEHFLLSSCLEGILAQRLVRRICQDGRDGVPENDDTILSEIFPGWDASRARPDVYRGKGCEKCNQTGYKGRNGIYELLVISEGIRQMILKRTSASIIRRRCIELGMKTLREDGWNKVRDGITTIEEVLRVTQVEGVAEV
ncbi:MAG: type II secretion system ATPase GspE [bacterium]